MEYILEEIKQFKLNATEERFRYIESFFIQNKNNENPNNIFIELFLIGANIRHRYNEITKEQHKQWIKYVNDQISYSGIEKQHRIFYLNCGLKS
jgi:hypothetical protein